MFIKGIAIYVIYVYLFLFLKVISTKTYLISVNHTVTSYPIL